MVALVVTVTNVGGTSVSVTSYGAELYKLTSGGAGASHDGSNLSDSVATIILTVAILLYLGLDWKAPLPVWVEKYLNAMVTVAGGSGGGGNCGYILLVAGGTGNSRVMTAVMVIPAGVVIDFLSRWWWRWRCTAGGDW